MKRIGQMSFLSHKTLFLDESVQRIVCKISSLSYDEGCQLKGGPVWQMEGPLAFH